VSRDAGADLRETMQWFARAVMTGDGIAEADRRLTAGPRMSPGERLDVYVRGYVARLVECLADDFPVLEHALGHEGFAALARTYIARFPSTAPNLNAYGRHMAAFCDEQGRAFEADLARLEWAVVEVIHAPSAPPLTMDRLAAIPMEAWAEVRLVASQAVRLLRTQYPVNDYFQAVRDERAPAIPAPSPAATVVYRGDTTVWRMGLTPPMAAVLDALLAGDGLGTALGHAEGTAPEQVMASFREWVQSGLFVDVLTG
jgi:hypothetical protein